MATNHPALLKLYGIYMYQFAAFLWSGILKPLNRQYFKHEYQLSNSNLGKMMALI